MRNYLLILLLAVAFTGCSKDTETEPETKQGVQFEFVTQNKLSSGELKEEGLTVNVVMIYKADGKDYEYNLTDGTYAYDKIAKVSNQPDYSLMNQRYHKAELEPGKYFVVLVTDDTVTPKYAYTYTTFTVTKGNYTKLRKDFSTMTGYRYNAW